MMDVRPEQVFQRYSFHGSHADSVTRSQVDTIFLASDALGTIPDDRVEHILAGGEKIGVNCPSDVLVVICTEFAINSGRVAPAVSDEGQRSDEAVSEFCSAIYAFAGMDEEDAEKFISDCVRPSFELSEHLSSH